MSAPRFSIVVPTRERPHTLAHTLATCLAQDGDFELVVSDNASGPRTRELVEGLRDPRVRYVRTPALLAMTDSLEFAVSHTRGEYVVIQGDDDGLMRHALPVVDRVIAETGAGVLRWDSVVYNWPDVSNPHFRANGLLVPLAQGSGGHDLFARDARAAIRAVAQGRAHYSDLPVIYNAAIRRDLLDRLRTRTGRVFKTRTPDVYAAFAVAALVDTFHSLRAPLGVCGRSGASTGVARHFAKKGSPIDNDFRRLNEAAGLHLHPWVPDLPPIPSAAADAFLWAKAELFPDDAGTELDRRELVRACLREVEADTADEWREALDSCRASMTDSPELQRWFESEYERSDFRTRPRPDRGTRWPRYGPEHLYLDAAAFGAHDIDAVAGLCENLFGYKSEGLRFRLSDGADARSVLAEKEAAVQYLSGECAQLQNQLHEKETVLLAALRERAAAEQRAREAEEAARDQRARADRLERALAEAHARVREPGLFGRLAARLRRSA